jgi:hypothetical protein
MASPATSHKIPSADPDMDRAIVEVIENADEYFDKRRALRREEARTYVRGALAAAARSRRSSHRVA